MADYPGLKSKAKGGDANAAKDLARAVHLRRQVNAYLYDKDVTRRVFDEIATRYKERKGGYTRIIKGSYRVSKTGDTTYTAFRRGDNAPMAVIQLV